MSEERIRSQTKAFDEAKQSVEAELDEEMLLWDFSEMMEELLDKQCPVAMKKLFEQRDTTKPGSKEEDQAVDRIMEAMFPAQTIKDKV